VAVAAYKQIKNSDFEVEKTEAGVASEFFRGKVDRVDGTGKYVRIIDYKTGHIDDSAGAYYTGRKLQMQLYMSELKGERVPAGVFYFPASVDYADDADGRFRMKGFLNGDERALRAGDQNIAEDKTSEFFPASLKNTRSKRVMDEQTIRDFLEYSKLIAKQGGEELKDGFIAPSPYEGGCGYCKYGGMCGFNHDIGQTRKEGEVRPAEIVEIVRKIKEGDKD
jgi:ATP-dependent helicase/DNAse subunit B